ncbi:hypothetical protein J6590_096555, partial [Homalodisca vitripennis]
TDRWEKIISHLSCSYPCLQQDSEDFPSGVVNYLYTRKDCNKSCCFLCKDKGLGGKSLGHIPGSGKCSIFKAALEKAKKKLS